SGHAADAFAPVGRALKLPTITENPTKVGYAKYYLGRASVETRRDVAGGLAMVRAARVALASDEPDVSMIREIDAWLAAHRYAHKKCAPALVPRSCKCFVRSARAGHLVGRDVGLSRRRS